MAVSGLERVQNAQHMPWSREQVQRELTSIMKTIHDRCVEFGSDGGRVDYRKGASIAGFVKLADAMLAQGVI